MLKILTKRERIILYTTIGVFIFSIGFNFLLMPILTKFENLNKELNLTQTKLKKYIRLLAQKDYIQNKFNKFASTVNLSTTGKDTLVNLLSELESMAKEANVRIIDIRPQSPRGLDLYQEILIDVRTEGSMEEHLKFIYNIENSLSILRIKKFQLIAKPNTSILEASLSISQLSGVE